MQPTLTINNDRKTNGHQAKVANTLFGNFQTMLNLQTY